MDSTRSPIPIPLPPALVIPPTDDGVGGRDGESSSIHFWSGAFLTREVAAPAAAARTCGDSSCSRIGRRPAGRTGLLPASSDDTPVAARPPTSVAKLGTNGEKNSAQC